MPSKAKPIETMTNPGGIGAAIAAREAKLLMTEETLSSGFASNGHKLTPNARARHEVRRAKLIEELRVLFERRAALASATAQRAPSSALSDWE